MENRIIFHIDVNSAYLSWEAVYRLTVLKEKLDLRQIPSAIGGSQKARCGIILAKSAPAKEYGVRTAETIQEALRKCPGLRIVPPRHDYYQQCSDAFLSILSGYSPILEKFSIDEAFLDMTESLPLFGTVMDAARQLKEQIKNQLLFTVNIGISSNKILAKMASDFEKPHRIHTLWPYEIREKLWPLPVNHLFFVGSSTLKKLHNLGIHTIGQLAAADSAIIKAHLGKHGQLIHEYANGIDHTPVSASPGECKGYGNSTTIDHDVVCAAEARRILLSLCENIATRLRQDHVKISVVSVVVKDCFLIQGSHQRTLDAPVDTASSLYQAAVRLFEEYWNGTPIRLLGIQTSKVTREEEPVQMDLFHMKQYEKQEKLEKAVDDIRTRFGDNAILRASFLNSSTSHMTGGRRKKNK